MTKKPAWNSFTKAELIKTIKKLDARQTKLLNELAAANELAEAHRAVACAAVASELRARPLQIEVPTGAELDAILEAQAPVAFPWETKE